MKSDLLIHYQFYFLSLLLSAFFLIIPEKSSAEKSHPFVKKIRVIGNTLLDSYDLDQVLDLKEGLTMTPEIMDMVVSELKATYHYHGHSFIDAYPIIKIKNERKKVPIIKVRNSRESLTYACLKFFKNNIVSLVKNYLSLVI